MAILTVSYGVSRSKNHYSEPIVSLLDLGTNKRYRAIGSGYDRLGTCFAMFLEDVYQMELKSISQQAYHVSNGSTPQKTGVQGALYGMTRHADKVTLDGGCGFESMLKIARKIGLSVDCYANRQGDAIRMFVG